MTRRRGSTLLVLAVAICISAAGAVSGRAQPPDAASALSTSLGGPGTPLGRTAAIAIDLRTGETLFQHAAGRSMIPASNEKLPVTFAALVRLGPRFRFHTDVVGTGVRRGAMWDGDLVLKGYGDPTFDSTQLARLVAVIRGRGIRSVTGAVLGDESYLDAERGAPGWKPGFVGEETPALSALVLDRGAGWPAFSPPLLAARAFRAALEAAGIDVAGAPLAGAAPAAAVPTLLASVSSAPLADVVARANTDSDNYVAEMILKQLGALETAPGTRAAGARVVVRTLEEAGIPTDGIRIVDGSGLSRLDRLTPRTLVAVVREGLRRPAFGAAFRRSLAVAGRSGTLEHRLPALTRVLRGKTGTTDRACSLTGTISSRIAFSVLENGAPLSVTAARAAQDRFVLRLSQTF